MPARRSSPWAAARSALVRDLDAAERVARPELAEQNFERFRTAIPLLVVAHLVAMATLAPWSRFGDYRSVAFVAHALTTVIDVVLLLALLRDRRGGRPAPDWLGDAAVVLYGAFGLAISTNAQRVAPSADFLNFAMFSTAVLFRARLGAVVGTYFGGAGLFWVALELLQPDLDVRRTVGTTTTAVALVALGFSRLLVRSDLRAIADRRLVAEQQEELEARQLELEFVNETLERKVEAQLDELLQRSQQVEALDAQLRSRVRARARDLVRALRQGPDGDARLAAGSLFAGRLVVRRLLGEGGMGEVYLAHDRVTGRLVALKRMRSGGPANAAALARFAAEAAASAAIAHPGIVRCTHVDVTPDGVLYQIIDYVKGCTLGVAVGPGRADVATALRLAAGVADVLAAAHAAGVVHRDVKPGNVMLSAEGAPLRILDFGISHLRDDPTEVTRTGEVVGTPRYMAPEQFQPGAAITGATDVYALGAVLFEMLAGRPPFVGSSLLALLRAHLEAPVPDVRDLNDDVPGDVAAIVARCLAKEPAARPEAAQLSEDLAAAADRLGAEPLEMLAPRLAGEARLRAFFELGAAKELEHAIALPPRIAAAREEPSPTEVATRETVHRKGA